MIVIHVETADRWRPLRMLQLSPATTDINFVYHLCSFLPLMGILAAWLPSTENGNSGQGDALLMLRCKSVRVLRSVHLLLFPLLPLRGRPSPLHPYLRLRRLQSCVPWRRRRRPSLPPRVDPLL